MQSDVYPSGSGKLGPLEYILNTPSHHRSHHVQCDSKVVISNEHHDGPSGRTEILGRQVQQLDRVFNCKGYSHLGGTVGVLTKKYAGVLIMWDHLFGTFEAEGKERIYYGLVHPVKTMNVLWLNFLQLMHIWNTFHKMKGFSNKFSMLFKGPGWSLGSPRLGNLEDIPEPDPNDPKFDPLLPLWCKLYIVCHFAILILELGNLIDRHMEFSSFILTCAITYLVYGLTVITIILEISPLAPLLESIRCVIYLILDFYILPGIPSAYQHWTLVYTSRSFHILSLMFWGVLHRTEQEPFHNKM
ncbi:alkylglycerol monooxygenase-like [Tachypleus tridentatus]|uniref:alkylglycerol monooxygenase-like n=1 Tax=Tachypleus tridentatus TaxID=6853 RepID=UPI003FD4917F